MLTDSQRSIIKSTVPLLESGGEVLTTHFYKLLMADYPEVLDFFNQAHQVSGAQPRALANSVLMYARHIDRLEQLGDLVSTIVNKHVALQILPRHYPMVGDCLLRAMRTVLGAEIATDEVIAAWAAAYGQLADILIGAEGQAYDAHASAPGGWRGARQFVLVRRVDESEEITSFYFSAQDGKAILAFEPGQYIGVRVVVDDSEQRRQYSLSAACHSAASATPQYRISVKREAGGKVSNYLHQQLQVGMAIDLYPPSGEFTLGASAKPLVLISGGVGITPLLAMLDAALPQARPITFIHAARHGGVHAFRNKIDALAQAHPQLQHFYCYEQRREQDLAAQAYGYLDQQQLAQWLPASRDVDVYFVGPIPFMQAVKQHLTALGVPATQSHFEFFGPAAVLN